MYNNWYLFWLPYHTTTLTKFQVHMALLQFQETCTGDVYTSMYQANGRGFQQVAEYINATMNQWSSLFPNNQMGFNGRFIRIGTFEVYNWPYILSFQSSRPSSWRNPANVHVRSSHSNTEWLFASFWSHPLLADWQQYMSRCHFYINMHLSIFCIQ